MTAGLLAGPRPVCETPLDFAFLVKERDGDDRHVFSFSIARNF
jgi:hypothetical protein